MSSYTIAKQDYMKAAGMLAGIAKELDLWIWDYETGRNSTPDDYKRRFAECYTMNSLSVMEQYHGDEVGAPSGDTSEYSEDFNAFFKTGKKLAIYGGKNLLNAILELSHFFGSAIYQTEKEPYFFKMQNYFDHIAAALFEKYHDKYSGYKCESWGRFEIQQDNNPDFEILF